jgi:hypothetical protein
MLEPDDASVGVLEFQSVTQKYVIKPGVELEGFTTVQK